MFFQRNYRWNIGYILFGFFYILYFYCLESMSNKTGNNTPKAKKVSLAPYLTVNTLPIFNLMNDLIMIKKMHEQKIIQLSPTKLQEVQSYQKMLKTICGFISPTSETSFKSQKRKSLTRNEQRSCNSRSPLLKRRQKVNQMQYEHSNTEKIEDKKISERQANLIFKSLFSIIENTIKEILLDFRLTTTDMLALLIKYKLTDDFLSKKSYQAIEEIMEKYNSTRIQKSDTFANSSLEMLFEQKNQLLSYPLKTLIDKAVQIMSNLPFYTSLIKQRSLKENDLNLKGIILAIAREYGIVPYHNFTHGFAVFASFFDVATIPSISKHFDHFSLFFALVACISHDVGHPGNNTLFEVKIKSDLAIQYCNVSVMEKMHLFKTMQILSRNPETSNLFSSLSQSQQTRARKIISNAILATDMTKHYSYLEKLENSIKMDKNHVEKNELTPEQKSLTMQILIHCCDIENPSFSYDCYLEWANLICLQFHMQVIKESVLKLQVTPFMKFDSLPYFYRNQISFASSTVLPIWQSLEQKFDELRIKKISLRIRQNLNMLTAAIRRNSQKNGPVGVNDKGNRVQKIEEFVGGRLQDFMTYDKQNLERSKI